MKTISSVLYVPFFFLCLHAAAQSPTPQAATATSAAVETIVCIRHGEKPPNDEGQLTFQGLNRALALPDVLIKKYGKAAFIFAPGTQHPVTRDGIQYSYIRPLITIEPTAIRLGLPVDARFAFDEIDPLQQEILSPPYRNALVFVAWEHIALEHLVKNIVSSFGGDPEIVPKWSGKDYDSIYVVKIRSNENGRTVTFEHDRENLDGQSTREPEPVKR
jgi:hypothetical protein